MNEESEIIGAANEPEAKVIIVTRDNGAIQHYAAPNFGMLHDGTLIIGERTGDAMADLRVDAMIAPGRWIAACKDGAQLRDAQKQALDVARTALNRTWAGLMNTDDPANVTGVRDIVDEALARLVDLGYE